MTTVAFSARKVVRWRGRLIGCLAATLAVFAVAEPESYAVDFEVEGSTAVQGYEVSSPWGDVTLERRRFMQTVGFGIYNLQGKYKPGEADYSIVFRMRLDADFGINSHLTGAQGGGETNFENGAGARYVPGLQEAPLDIMYGYVEGRNLANGWLGFRLGRQYTSDVLGLWSFDGGLVRVTTPFYLQLEVYGGLEQRGGFPLSSSRYEAQGVWRGSHRDFGQSGQPSSSAYPSYQFAEPAPAFGAALESVGPSWVHGRFSYRRVYNTGRTIAQQFPDATGGYPTTKGTRISQDRLGYAIDLNKTDLGGIKGGFTYDLYNQLVGSFFGGIEAYVAKPVTIGIDVDYFEPTFDADSIWNWFTKSPITTLTGRTAVQFTERFDVAASGGVRLWQVQGDPDTFRAQQCESEFAGNEAQRNACLAGTLPFDPDSTNSDAFRADEAHRTTKTTADVLANLSGRYRWRSAEVGLRGMLQTGDRGRRTGGDLSGEKRLDGGRYSLGGRVSLYDWVDPIRPDRNATSFGYVLGAGYRPPGDFARLRFEWEHDMNRLVGQRYRVVALLDLWVGQ